MRLKCPVCGAWINVGTGRDRLTRCPICSARLRVTDTNFLLPLMGFGLVIVIMILSAANLIWFAILPLIPLIVAIGSISFARAVAVPGSDLQARRTPQTRNEPSSPNVSSGENIIQSLPATHADDTTIQRFCMYCGRPIMNSWRFCANCGASLASPRTTGRIDDSQTLREVDSLGTCMVCGLAIQPSAQVVYCIHCGNVAHRLHLLEWIHVKRRCPICEERLTEDDI
jgi:predicted nucleic acid-binding Zn ribbon protein